MQGYVGPHLDASNGLHNKRFPTLSADAGGVIYMASALDLIKGALRRINSYQSGESIAAPDANDCLETLNDMLDSWSIDKNQVFGTNENVLNWTPGKSQYTIGNPTSADLGEPPFVATITGGSNVLSVTSIPADLIAGATVTDSGAAIPSATTVTAVGSSTVTLSQVVPMAPAVNPVQVTYTIPGDFGIPRPIRITGGFTRFNNLDFTLDVYESQERFLEILYKAQPGPWPTVAWYNNQFPYGVLNVYQTPGNGAPLYLYTDTILANLTLDQTVILPQGYTRALKWCLAKEICAEFGFPLTDAIKIHAAESLNLIKALNAKPAVVSRYDRELVRGNRPDGGWIIRGGYR